MASLKQIKHIVVLMLENRSFDSMLGGLYPKSNVFDGLSGSETNPDLAGNPVQVWNQPGTDKPTMSIPDPDPGELWLDMNMQLFGTANIASPVPVPTMSGFVRNYQSQAGTSPGTYVPDRVMHYYSRDQVPVISQLARQFAVCDRWHASAPCQTWPNRFFVHAGTAHGYENNSPPHFPYEMPTIFNRFEDLRIKDGWKIYFHDVPQSITLAKLWPHLGNFRFYAEFRQAAKTGDLPKYSFIEPRYFTDVDLPNDQHPPHVVSLGEHLIADVYNSVRGGKAWFETLLIITYDEHGGNYDHVPPPPATPPDLTPSSPFNFDRYGVRVPAVIVSPFVRQGTILRPGGSTPFDHTSILSSLRKAFRLGEPLTHRDADAPDLEPVLNLDSAENLGPETIECPPYVPTPRELEQAKAIPLNGMQKSLLALGRLLPEEGSNTENAIDKLRRQPPMTISEMEQMAAEAKDDIEGAVGELRGRLSSFFGN